FFFQAEDGIRDRNVTGVQTCALPISLVTLGAGIPFVALLTLDALVAFVAFLSDQRPEGGRGLVGHVAAVLAGQAVVGGAVVEDRSEERRVGKEGRSRGAEESERGQDE